MEMDTGGMRNLSASKYVSVGITGHRDLIEEDKNFITKLVKEKLNQIRATHGKNIKLYSALAPGADLWVAQCLEPQDALGIVKVLPYAVDKKFTFWGERVGKEPKKSDFKCSESYEITWNEWHNKKAIHEKLWQQYEDLRKAANSKIINLVTENVDFENEKDRNEQYIKLGEFLVKNCYHLIALWDGVDGGGVGGTSDVVRMWQKGKGLSGNTIKKLKPNRILHHLICPRSKNYFPIYRNY
jgi:hypothetical protein